MVLASSRGLGPVFLALVVLSPGRFAHSGGGGQTCPTPEPGPDPTVALLWSSVLGIPADKAEELVLRAPGLATLPEATVVRRLENLGEALSSFARGGDRALPPRPASLVRRCPWLLQLRPEGIHDRFEALQRLLPSTDIVHLVTRQPSLLALNSSTNLEVSLDALVLLLFGPAEDGSSSAQRGSTARRETERLVSRFPSLLAGDPSLVEGKVSAVADLLNVSTSSAARLLLTRAPGVLTLSVEHNILPTAKAIQELLPAVDIQKLLQRAPSLLGYSPATLRLKLDALKAALPGADVSKLVASSPALLTFNIKANVLPKLRSLQQLLAEIPASTTDDKKAMAVRRSAAATLLASRGGRSLANTGRGKRQPSMHTSIIQSAISVRAAERQLEGGLAPLMPRADVIRIVEALPSLLQRNVSRNLRPKVAALRDFLGNDTMTQELIRESPRVLLSSMGVLARIGFLRKSLATSNPEWEKLLPACRTAVKSGKQKFFDANPGYADYLTGLLLGEDSGAAEPGNGAVPSADLEDVVSKVLEARHAHRAGDHAG